ncbi:P-loop containing nucleoside triphosphate hydrolase protein [Coniella lustricola]|uniref:RNA helicase n=1 Tax=Coniella lustricola TaxID=2025994 RepID=A0A2T3AJ86_9PEZI|nr:P-loop containing nucleoside triphosphate hydrolase protein [Coniella lustricola]
MVCQWRSVLLNGQRSFPLRPLITNHDAFWIVKPKVRGQRYRNRSDTRRSRPPRMVDSGPLTDHGSFGGAMPMHLFKGLREGLEKSATRVEPARTRGKRVVVHEDVGRFNIFQRLVDARFAVMLRFESFHELKALGIKDSKDLQKEARLFKSIINRAFDLASRNNFTSRRDNPYFYSWRQAFIEGDTSGLHTELKYSFTSFIVRQHLSSDAIAQHEKLADFRFPHEWFPATRTMQRTVHLHVGPTNSGKTYNALKALEQSKTGIYAGPLRLLAHETYMRFTAKGKRCALVTGEEQRIPPGDEDYYASCTVEMAPLNRRVDVAIIDEIQMIGDEQRGWAWTQAVLGIQAKELHLCGEERAVPLIQDLCAKTGDKVVVHRYQRLNALQPMQEGLGGSFEKLQKGDAVVSFSRVNLHAIKAGIEKATGKKCAIVYGALPPESRAQQAALFNDPNNEYDFLAASDAIGMGLNLEVRRVIFEAVTKHDGIKIRELNIPELKQIGGRAGRFKSAAQGMQDATGTAITERKEQPGFVTTLENEDLDVIHNSFAQEPEPIAAAGLFPPSFIIEKFASYFPAGTPFSFILLRLRDIARIHGRFQLCSFKDQINIANIIQSFDLSIRDRCIFLVAPITLRDQGVTGFVRELASRVAKNQTGHLLDFPEVNLEILEYEQHEYPQGSAAYLKNLESLHKCLTLYLWLSYRYVGIFQSQTLAFHVKQQVEEKINSYLDNLNYSAAGRQSRLAQQRRAVKKRSQNASLVFGDEMGQSPPQAGQEPMFA